MQFDVMSPSLEVMTIVLIRVQFITYAVTLPMNDTNDLAMCIFITYAYAEVCSQFRNFFGDFIAF